MHLLESAQILMRDVFKLQHRIIGVHAAAVGDDGGIFVHPALVDVGSS